MTRAQYKVLRHHYRQERRNDANWRPMNRSEWAMGKQRTVAVTMRGSMPADLAATMDGPRTVALLLSEPLRLVLVRAAGRRHRGEMAKRKATVVANAMAQSRSMDGSRK